ncbi:GNAT family N-acetyltransferase [Candidatus Pacearchaeota archaeon]|nr:GNAT family N-acetyltransferase [Candidatus Pacearchaeota archaeon]
MRIRKATLRDVGGILILCKKLEDSHQKDGENAPTSFMKSKRSILEKDISSGKGAVFLSEDEEGFIGYVFVVKIPPKEKAGKNSAGYISDLYVEEKYRKSGLGSELIKEAQEWLRKKGKKNVTLHVESWNIGAINLYRKLEFKDKSIRMEKKL